MLKRVVILVAAVFLAVGCDSQGIRRPMDADKVPITRPQFQAPLPQRHELAEPVAAEPATQPAGDQSVPLTSLADEARPQSRPAASEPTTSASAPTTTAPAATAPAEGAKTIASAALQIGGEFITIEDVLKAVRPKLATLPAGLSVQTVSAKAAEAIRSEVSQRIRDAIVLREASKRIDESEKKFIETEQADRLRDMINEAGGSRQKLQQQLAEQGTSIDEVQRKQRDRLTIQLFLQGRFHPAISVNRQMLLDYYLKHAEEFSSPKQVQMRLIAAPLKEFGGDTGKARAAIQQASDALAAGEDFAGVAERFSRGPHAGNGGLWNPMASGSLKEAAVEQAAFALAEGDVSGVIETPTGYYIVKAAKVIPATSVSFEDAQEDIEAKLSDEQYRRLVAEYFDRLAGEVEMIQSAEFISAAVDQAVREYAGR